MITTIALFVCGLCLSSFFSGSETGFYRVTKTRLLLHSKSGGWMGKVLLWLANNPSIYVATALIGNNIANFIVAKSLVMFGQQFFHGSGLGVEFLLPILMTPFLFVYGELLPKYLFHQAPFRLLLATAPLVLIVTALLLPISIIVVVIERTWKRWLGVANIEVQPALERQVLQRVLAEGQEAGVLKPIQRELSQNLFKYGDRPIRQFAMPTRALPCVRLGADRDEVLSEANRTGQSMIGVLDSQQSNMLVGYYRIADVLASSSNQMPEMHKTAQVSISDSHLQVLTQLENQHSEVAQVVDARGRALGIITRRRLLSMMLSGSAPVHGA